VRKALLYLISVWTLVFGLWVFPATASAATSLVEGYAWSSNIGWVSFNCKNSDSCGTSNYGVNLDRATGNLSGYAWNSNIGWISFQAGDVVGCPSEPCIPKIVGSALGGWARAISGRASDGWDGWIHLSGTSYGVSFDGTKFTGYSWGDVVIGWMSWTPSKGPGVYSIDDTELTTGVSGGGSSSQVQADTDTCTLSSCVYTYEQGSTANLIATAAPGFAFDRWTGASAGECASLTSRFCSGITMSSAKEIKAQFRGVVCPDDGPGLCPVCNDNEDNDSDGLTDWPDDSGCTSALGGSEMTAGSPACDDCLDNDGDGKIDWLADTGCNGSPADPNEVNAILSVAIIKVSTGNGKVTSLPAAIDCGSVCSHEYTQDESIKLTALPIGMSVFDRWGGACSGTGPTCELVMTASRAVTATFKPAEGIICPAGGPDVCPECNDGVDNDDDSKIDWPDDDGCTDLDDDDERSLASCPAAGPGICPECNDGIDNDGDGQIDFPNDLQCDSLDDNNESATGINCPADGPGICPQCNDGIDNTDPEDTIIDYPKDPGCFNRADNNETDPVIIGNCPADGPDICPQCNDGIDNEGDGFIDWSGWDADKDGSKEIPKDPSCQGEPNKDNEAGGIKVIEV